MKKSWNFETPTGNFYNWLQKVCDEQDIDLNAWRWAIQLERTPTELPHLYRGAKSTGNMIYFSVSGVNVILLRNTNGIKGWIREHGVVNQWYNAKPRMGSRRFSHYAYTKLNRQYDPAHEAYDIEMERIRDVCKHYGVEYVEEVAQFQKHK
mgnify:CR=1 FL=1